LLYGIKDLASFLLVDEIETDERKVSAAEADGGELAGGRGSRAQSAESDDRVGKPEFFRSYRNTFCLILAGDRGDVGKDQVVRGEVECAVDLLTTASQGHIVNLG
jgi:hypothetical protein